MRVSKVLDPASNAVSYTVVGVTGVVEPAERYLRYLAETERSPNSIKAHAHDLKDWFVFLDEYGLDWQSVKLEDVGAFIRWLRRPPDMRGQVFSVLPTIGHHCGEATVNRKLSTVSIFYQHAARHGLDLGELITCWDRDARPGRWKPFQHHISKGTAKQRQVVKLPVTARFPRLTFQSLSDGARWAATLGEWKFEPSYSIWTTPCSIIRHLPAPEWTLSFDISERSIPTN
jgi:integrase/recombinase XerD